jgi:hypothetical protein
MNSHTETDSTHYDVFARTTPISLSDVVDELEASFPLLDDCWTFNPEVDEDLS